MASSPLAVAPPGLVAKAPESRRRPPVRLPLVQQFLDEQQRLSVVERFAALHEREEAPLQARYYKDLIPSGKPGSGQQYAFSVDLDKCTGCKACVTGCRSLNGLDPSETWRAVGTMHGGTVSAPYQQSVTAACHHCVDPGCMKGCPVGAYEKDPETGIVKHLDDQCIGCQYCTLTCPYEVPQYNERLGIVRKCDLCSDRLSAGEAPACVQACPSEAISVRIIDQADAVAAGEHGVFLPAAPDPAITLPTTVYESKRVLPKNTVPADLQQLRPAAQHAPLAVTLVLTQLSFGAFTVAMWLGRSAPSFEQLRPYHALLSLAMGLLALTGSLFHLGRPQFAHRAILGIRTSWLSREIVAFGAFAKLSILYAGVLWYKHLATMGGLPSISDGTLRAAENVLSLSVVGAGGLGVVCSAMLYAVTGRTYWTASSTLGRFFLSAVVLGLSTTHLVVAAGGPPIGAPNGSMASAIALGLAGVMAVKLAHEAAVLFHLRSRRHADLRRTATLLVTELSDWAALRLGAGLFGGVAMPLLVRGEVLAGRAGNFSLAMAIVSFALVLFGELSERALFFMGVSAPRMPGGVGSS